MRLKIFLQGTILMFIAGCSHSIKQSHSSLIIKTANNLESEKKTKENLEQLVSKYNVGPFIFTKTILIDENALPHSHPILTLHSRYQSNSDRLLSLFLHEQIHWLEDSKGNEFKAAMAELKQIYPNPPSGFPEAANNKESTYRHFVVNYLELQALRKFVGKNQAEEIFKKPHVYTWIYSKVLADEDKVGEIVRKYNLNIELVN